MNDAAVSDSPRLYLVRRQSPDWARLSVDEFAAQSRRFYRMLGQPENLGVEIAELWGRTFTISFCEARQAMKDIATANLRAAEDAVLLDDPTAVASSTGEQAICYFVDDDDWVQPSIRQRLAAHAAPEYDGYIWRQIRCGRARGNWLTLSPQNNVCGTNNYAVGAGFLRRDPANLERVYQHFSANDVFPSLRVCVLAGEMLSATNRHPGSTLALTNGLREEFTSERLTAVVDHYNRRLAEPPVELPAGASWVLPWVGEVRRFYLRLAASRRK